VTSNPASEIALSLDLSVSRPKVVDYWVIMSLGHRVVEPSGHWVIGLSSAQFSPPRPCRLAVDRGFCTMFCSIGLRSSSWPQLLKCCNLIWCYREEAIFSEREFQKRSSPYNRDRNYRGTYAGNNQLKESLNDCAMPMSYLVWVSPSAFDTVLSHWVAASLGHWITQFSAFNSVLVPVSSS